MRKDGDPACLQAKALDDAALVARGRALLQRYGVQMAKVLNENFDRAAYQAALSAAGEPDAEAELARLDERSRREEIHRALSAGPARKCTVGASPSNSTATF